VEVTGGFLLLMAWVNYCDTQQLLPAVLCAATVHELGHCAVIWAANGRIRLLRLSAVGAELQVEGTLSYVQELACAIAGPMLNLFLAVLAACIGWNIFAGINLALGVFNLLPIGALDGGRIVNCVSAILLGPDKGCRFCSRVNLGFVLAITLGGAVLFLTGGSMTLLLVGAWLLRREL